MNEQGKGLWAAIHAKRKRIKAGSGERMRKPGEKGAPTPQALKRARDSALKKEEMTTTASIPNPADTAMGPRLKMTNVTDRRRKKDKVPVLLKRFRKYIEND